MHVADPTLLNLTQQEINDICHPLTQKAAQAKFLAGLGLHVDRRPDGSPLVARAHYLDLQARQRARAAAAAPAQPARRTAPATDGPVWSVNP